MFENKSLLLLSIMVAIHGSTSQRRTVVFDANQKVHKVLTSACPNEFTRIGYKCYFFFPQLVNWFVASATCKQISSTLVTAYEEDLRTLVLYAKEYPTYASFWLHGTDPSYGTGLTPSGLIDRNNLLAASTCPKVQIRHAKATVLDSYCSEFHRFICEASPIQIEDKVSEVKSMQKHGRHH